MHAEGGAVRRVASLEARTESFARAVVRPALLTIGMYSRRAEHLLLGTAIQESGLTHRDQQDGGPALGLFQIEPATHDDIWANYLEYRTDLAPRVQTLLVSGPSRIEQLRNNDLYGAALARVLYERTGRPLPAVADIDAHASFWKEHYNTPRGQGEVDQYVANWLRCFPVNAGPRRPRLRDRISRR